MSIPLAPNDGDPLNSGRWVRYIVGYKTDRILLEFPAVLSSICTAHPVPERRNKVAMFYCRVPADLGSFCC